MAFLHITQPARYVWTCGFLPVSDLFFRLIFLFVIVEMLSRCIVHFGVTWVPSDEWESQQLEETSPFGQDPRCSIRARGIKYGESFTWKAKGSSIEILKTTHRTPKGNAMCAVVLHGIVTHRTEPSILRLGPRVSADSTAYRKRFVLCERKLHSAPANLCRTLGRG